MFSRCGMKVYAIPCHFAIMQIKQEAMRMLGQLHEVEAKRDQLLAEDARHEDPQVERERLLAQVKDDNRETANMDRE